MIQLPKIKRDPKVYEDLCKCRPVCKSRRRVWKGQTQKTSAELLLERKPPTSCYRRWPKKVYPNGPCPLFGRVKGITVNEVDAIPEHSLVRICQAPVDDTVDTTYLRYAEIAHKIGAWAAVSSGCAFCKCCACCPCALHEYLLSDVADAARARRDRSQFDARVKTDQQAMRIMYDKI